jgi:hypothetical protein
MRTQYLIELVIGYLGVSGSVLDEENASIEERR